MAHMPVDITFWLRTFRLRKGSRTHGDLTCATDLTRTMWGPAGITRGRCGIRQGSREDGRRSASGVQVTFSPFVQQEWIDEVGS